MREILADRPSRAPEALKSFDNNNHLGVVALGLGAAPAVVGRAFAGTGSCAVTAMTVGAVD